MGANFITGFNIGLFLGVLIMGAMGHWNHKAWAKLFDSTNAMWEKTCKEIHGDWSKAYRAAWGRAYPDDPALKRIERMNKFLNELS